MWGDLLGSHHNEVVYDVFDMLVVNDLSSNK
jgi:hypothetical protein